VVVHEETVSRVGGRFSAPSDADQSISVMASPSRNVWETLYASGEPENRFYGCGSMAGAHLAITHLMEGDRRGAESVMAPILALPSERRIGSLGTTLGTGRSLLSGRPGGEHLARQIEDFCSAGLPQQARRAISDRSGQ
jgi:hypothetical protein